MGMNKSVEHLQGLYTVVGGVALALAINGLIDQNAVLPVRLSLIPYFAAYLVTLVPIYHGALRHLDVVYVEEVNNPPRPGALMVDWSLLFVESCILLALAVLISRPLDFMYAFTGLLAFDASWAFVAYLGFSPKGEEKTNGRRARPPEQKWAIINFSAVVFLIVILVALHVITGTAPSAASEHLDTYRWILMLVVAVGRTVWDYSWCWDFYYRRA